jgi:hypothetical protein
MERLNPFILTLSPSIALAVVAYVRSADVSFAVTAGGITLLLAIVAYALTQVGRAGPREVTLYTDAIERRIPLARSPEVQTFHFAPLRGVRLFEMEDRTIKLVNGQHLRIPIIELRHKNGTANVVGVGVYAGHAITIDDLKKHFEQAGVALEPT